MSLVESLLLTGCNWVSINIFSYVHGAGEITANPAGVAPPDVWILGGKRSVALAAGLGAALCLNMFSSPCPPEEGQEIIGGYRAAFRCSGGVKEALPAVALAGVCADSADRAQMLAQQAPDGFTPRIVGDPKQCHRLLKQICFTLRVNIAIFVDLCNVTEDRLRSYELLADGLHG